jgi:hypothetical protein
MLTPIEIAERNKLLAELSLIEEAIVSREHEAEIRRCASDPWYWFTKYVKTVDEEDPTDPIKPYPDYEYLHDVIKLWQLAPAVRALAFEKSRRMLLTLTVMGLLVWDSMFLDGRIQIIISQNEEKANVLCGITNLIG